MENNTRVSGNFVPLLNSAVRCGEMAMVKQLVSWKKIDPNFIDEDGDSALCIASTMGQYEIVIILINAGADPNAYNGLGSTPLILATINGYKNIIELLLMKGARKDLVDGFGNTALMWASYWCRSSIIELLT